MFTVPALAAVLSPGAVLSRRTPRWTPAWLGAAVSLSLLIGLRYQVGGDWPNYIEYFERVRDVPLAEVLGLTDPGYQLLNWLSLKMGWGIFGTNLICGIMFTAGLLHFCRNLPRPWLAVTIAVPYLVIVVAMGYTRQDISRIFLWQAMIVLLIGTVIGCLFGGISTYLVSQIPLPITGIFKTSHFLVYVTPWHYAQAVTTALLMVMLASLVPSRRAARLEPGDIVRGTAQ